MPERKHGSLTRSPQKPVRDAFLSVCLYPSMYLYTKYVRLYTYIAEHPRGDATAPRRYLPCPD